MNNQETKEQIKEELKFMSPMLVMIVIMCVLIWWVS